MHAPTHRVAAGAALLLALLAATPRSSSAASVSGSTARFAVSISGKFTSSGNAKNPCLDAAENPIVVQDAAETTWTFASTKAGRAEFLYVSGDLSAGMTKLMSVAATGVRTASESPNCAPRYPSDQPIGSSCGTKHANYLMSIYANSRPARVGYAINKNAFSLTWPEDPWVAVDRWCPPLAVVWTTLNVYTARPTPVSQAKIFNKGAHRIVVNGKRAGGETNLTASSTWALEYTITLTRGR
jgi:hypothetical protein